MTFLNTKIASRRAQKWFLVMGFSLVIFSGFEALAFLTGIYQIKTFITVATLLYIFMILDETLIFDLRLKIPKSWERSKRYFKYNKQYFFKWFKIIARALKSRFRYFNSWSHWLHFQNYLILPAVVFWGAVVLIFLNPFSDFLKQTLAISATLLLTVVTWYIKTIFFNYSGANWQVRNVMFTIHVIASFLVFSGLLGLTWYFGLGEMNFVAGSGILAFLLMYQAAFRLQALSSKNLLIILCGSILVAAAASLVFRYWTVNFYSGGLMLTNIQHFIWGITRLKIKRSLNLRLVIEYVLIFVFVVFFIFATTNFQARIG